MFSCATVAQGEILECCINSTGGQNCSNANVTCQVTSSSSSSSGECIPQCNASDNWVMPPGQGFSDGYVVYCPQGFGNAAYCFNQTAYCIDTNTNQVFPGAVRCSKCPTCDSQDYIKTVNGYIALCPANLGNAFPYCYNQGQYCINIDNSIPYSNASFCSYGIGQCPTCDASGMIVVPNLYYASCSQSGYVPACNATIPGCFNTTTYQFTSYTASCLLTSGGP
jgi:hypothetical protein